MKNKEFWNKVSNFAIIICGIVLVVKMFFRQYVESIIWPLLLFGVFAFFIFAIAELILFIKKKNQR